MSIPYPDIDPVAIALGPIHIRWYALAYLSGILLGWLYCRAVAYKDEIKGLRPNREDIDNFITFSVLGIILGGRFGYVLFYQSRYYFSHPLEILEIWHGGMSFHGGALGVIIALIGFSRYYKLPLLRLADIICASVPIGLFFGRIANFINGELYGRVTDVSWGVVFPGGGDLPRHPSQLYEASLEGVLLFGILALLIWQDKIRSKSGIVTGAFLAGYGMVRFFLEQFREPDAYLGFIAGGLTMGQLLCLPMIALGLGVIFYALRKENHVVNLAA